MNDEPYTCKLCGDYIAIGERWEYFKVYAYGTPEEQKERVHSSCVAMQLRDVLRLMSEVPEDERD